MARVGVDPNDPLDANVEAGFFLDLANHRLSKRLADVHRPTRQGPVARVASPLEQDPALTVHHYRGATHYQRVRRWRLRVVVIISALRHAGLHSVSGPAAPP